MMINQDSVCLRDDHFSTPRVARLRKRAVSDLMLSSIQGYLFMDRFGPRIRGYWFMTPVTSI